MWNKISRLFRHEQFVGPTTEMTFGSYRDSFDRAVEFTRICGFQEKPPTWGMADVLDPAGDFIAPVYQAAGVIDPAKSAGQCLKWCHYLQPEFESYLGKKVWLTIGQLWKGDTYIFNPTFDDIKAWCKGGIQLSDLHGRQGLNLHAWLTLESGEIIEPTFLSSLAKIHPNIWGDMAGAIAWGQSQKVLNDHRYFPMLVGRDAVTSIGNRSIIPLLAKNSEELHSVHAVAYLAGR